MNKKALLIGLAMLEDAYENFDVIKHERKLKLWQTMFQDVGEDKFLDAIQAYINSSVYSPTIAAIKTLIREGQEGDAVTAWEEVRQAIKQGRFYRGMPEFDDPILNKTLKGWSFDELGLMKTEEAGIFRSQFIKAYNSNKERAWRPALRNNEEMEKLTSGLFKELPKEVG